DRYLTLQTRVAGAVNLAHSARPEWGDNLIRAETTSRRERHGTSLRPIVRSDGGTVHSSEASWRPRADALAAGAGLTASPSRERRSGWIRSRRWRVRLPCAQRECSVPLRGCARGGWRRPSPSPCRPDREECPPTARSA